MENVNIIFLTNKEDDLNYLKTLSHLKEYSIGIDEIKSCWMVDNFAFALTEGNYRFYDHLIEGQIGNEKPTEKAFEVIEKFENEIYGQSQFKTLLAVHWGERNEDDIKSLLKSLNRKENIKNKNVAFSYWGSQSKSYGVHYLDLIKNEILNWANIYENDLIAELKETIEIFKHSHDILNRDYETVIDKFKHFAGYLPFNLDSLKAKVDLFSEIDQHFITLGNKLNEIITIKESHIPLLRISTEDFLEAIKKYEKKDKYNLEIAELKADIQAQYAGFKKHFERLKKLQEIYKEKESAISELEIIIQKLKNLNEN